MVGSNCENSEKWLQQKGDMTMELEQNGATAKAAVADPHGKNRERWATKFDFMVACIGYSIGYGNVWRFPYLVYKNGGGAFFVPFFLSVILGGIPIFFLEVIQGQFVGGGGIKVWKLVPVLQGMGVATMIISFFCSTFYNILQTWSIRYFIASFSWVLPWENCDNEWNTEFCVDGEPRQVRGNNDTILGYLSSRNITVNDTNLLNDPAAEFWEHRVLGISDGITEVGTIIPDLLLCFFIAWVIVFISIFGGIRHSGRVMYFTVPAPFVLMAVLVIRGLTLPGAWDGVVFYLKPDFSKLLDILVWADAGTQVLYSYSISVGVLNALGSYNPWHHNSLRDTLVFGVVDAVICLVAGLITFPVLGYMAHMKGVDIRDVAEQGPGLVFVVYPKAISLMPFAPVWAVIFFAMLILVGIDSQFVGIEGFIAAFSDYIPKRFRRNRCQRALIVGVTCLVFFLAGLPMITNGGMYVFQILDYYTGCRIIMLVAMLESIGIGWIYGSSRFCKNMEMMWQFKLPQWLKTTITITWKYVTPIFVCSQFIINSIQYTKSLTYKRNARITYEYPDWAVGMGWVLAYSGVIFVPIVAIYRIVKVERGSIWARIRHLTLPILKSYMVLPDAKPGSYVPDPDEQADAAQDLMPATSEQRA